MDRRQTRIHIGTRGWHYPHDVSGFFPEDLPPDWRLELYTTQFHALELPPQWALPDSEDVAQWEAETLEDAALALPLVGDWGQHLAAGGDLRPLAKALAPLEDKLAVVLWPQTPSTQAEDFWPGVYHVDSATGPLTELPIGTPEPQGGFLYWRLEGPGRYHPETLETFASHLLQRAAKGCESFVFFGEPSYALLDAGILQEAVDRHLAAS
ncbi:hypothetical protein [Thiohalorhabdus sp.]|uniref:hypothetical protein n=1 Tax=Thiohalorhabdus sp. TaxID=3094134 RepID=UPI002FC386D8